MDQGIKKGIEKKGAVERRKPKWDAERMRHDCFRNG